MGREQADDRPPLAGRRFARFVAADEVNAYYEAQRRATRARVRTDKAAPITGPRWPARSPGSRRLPEMDIDVVRAVVAEEERTDPDGGFVVPLCALRLVWLRRGLLVQPGKKRRVAVRALARLALRGLVPAPENPAERTRRERRRARERNGKSRARRAESQGTPAPPCWNARASPSTSTRAPARP